MAHSTEVQEFLDQMQDTRIGLVALSDEELVQMINGSSNQWEDQQTADLLARMPVQLDVSIKPDN